MYKRPGRTGWYCSLNGRDRHISLETNDEEIARERFGKLLDRERLRKLAPNARPIAEIFATTRTSSEVANTEKTAYELHRNLLRVLTWLEQRGVVLTSQITKQLVDRYKAYRRGIVDADEMAYRKAAKIDEAKPIKAVSAARINREIDSWRRAVIEAVEDKIMPPDAPSWFVRLREPRPLPHRPGYSADELSRFIEATPPGYRTLFQIALGTGMRDEELRHMKATDLERKGWIVVTPMGDWSTKGYRHRWIPVLEKTTEACREWIKLRDEVNTDKKKVWKVAQRAAKAANVRPISLHELRRAWGSHLLAAGNRLEDISRWYGHADIATTMRYLRVISQDHPTDAKLPW